MATNQKLSEKLYAEVNLKLDNVTYPYVTSFQAHYVPCQKKDGTPGWTFDQFEGSLYARAKDGKPVPTGAKWYWGIDKRHESPNLGRLWKDLGKEGAPGKVVLMAHGVPFDPWSIAAAVQDAVTTGKGVIPNPFEALAAAQEPAPIPAPTTAEPKTALREITPEDAAAVDEDIALLDGDGKDPLTRLKIGDPSLFIELGFAEGQALNWAMQIRSGSVSVNDVEDVKNIRGIGRKNAAKLKAALKAKYAA